MITSHNGKDYQQGSYLGPSFSKSEIKAFNEAVTDWERKRYFEQL